MERLFRSLCGKSAQTRGKPQENLGAAESF
jgi:hypothetical protein